HDLGEVIAQHVRVIAPGRLVAGIHDGAVKGQDSNTLSCAIKLRGKMVRTSNLGGQVAMQVGSGVVEHRGARCTAIGPPDTTVVQTKNTRDNTAQFGWDTDGAGAASVLSLRLLPDTQVDVKSARHITNFSP